MNDSSGFCKCDRCRSLDFGRVMQRNAIDAEETKGSPSRNTVITDRIYTFVNQVSERVRKRHSGKYVVSMAYSRYILRPEKVTLHPYAIPQYCLWSAYRHSNPDSLCSKGYDAPERKTLGYFGYGLQAGRARSRPVPDLFADRRRWRFVRVAYLQTGQYFSPSFSGSDPSNTNTSGGLPDLICDGNLPAGQRAMSRWFDTSCFAVPPAGRFGNSGMSILEGPACTFTMSPC